MRRPTRGSFLERVSWRLVRAGELAEGHIAVRPRARTRYALLALWCAVLGVWLTTLRVHATLTALLRFRPPRRRPSRSSADPPTPHKETSRA